MNERIRELVEQATSIVEVKHEGYRGKGYTTQDEFFDKEKFAELIVRECVEIARQHNLEKADRSHLIHRAIKQHFGVEP